MLQAKPKPTEQSPSAMSDFNLMPNEQVQQSLGVDDTDASNDSRRNIVLLTDRRVLHIVGAGPNRKTSYAAIEDISAVEITRQSAGGYGAFVWAALAFFVAAMLWRVIENPTLSYAAAAIVTLMGIYLIVDRLLSRGEHALVFKAGSAEIQCALKRDADNSEAETLITRLFELKEERSKPQYGRAKSFSPR